MNPPRKFLLLVALALIAAWLPAGPAHALTEGSIDPTFGTNGITKSLLMTPNATAVQPDGKIVVVGQSAADTPVVALLRLNRNGTIDNSFGSSGAVLIPMGTGVSNAAAVAIQPDGKIVIAGSADGTTEDMMVARLTTQGALDSSFGLGGIATMGIGAAADEASALAIQPDGKIVIAGTFFNGLVNRFGIVRYTSNGAPDPTFSGDGIAASNIMVHGERASAVGVLPNGDIIVAGATANSASGGISTTDTALAMFTPNGDIDDSFGQFGADLSVFHAASGTVADGATSLAVDSEGRIVVAGYAAGPDGQTEAIVSRWKLGFAPLDTTFGSGGVQDLQISGTDSTGAASVNLQPDGKIVVFGAASLGSQPHLDGFRLTADGNFDTTFASQGVFFDDAGASQIYQAPGSAIGPDGSIVVSGWTTPYGASVVKFVGDLSDPFNPLVTGLPVASLGPETLSWSASDAGTGVRNYDIRKQIAKSTQPDFGKWGSFRKATTDTSRALKLGRPGTTECFEARARDFAGNVSDYGSPTCTIYPLDDRNLKAHGTWTKTKDLADYRGTAMTSTTAGDTLTATGYFRRLAVVVTTCPTCGTLQVFNGSTLLTTLGLSSNQTKPAQIFFLPAFPPLDVQHATITVQQASQGEPVIIDGLAFENA